MKGIDQKNFKFNDIVPLVITDPTNSTTYNVIVNADVNGYTWDIINGSGTTVGTGTQLYGAVAG
jgi:hypothetical protein